MDNPQVKNTFLEFSLPAESGKAGKRRARSDFQDPRLSPLVVASKSPLLRPADMNLQAVPIEEVAFELLEESVMDAETGYMATEKFQAPGCGSGACLTGDMVAQSNTMPREEVAYVVPTTPSPFLHYNLPCQQVPPFNGYDYGGMGDVGLPPAFTEGQDGIDGSEFAMQANGEGMEGQFMPSMAFIPEMYDGSYGPMDGGYGHMNGVYGQMDWTGWALPEGAENCCGGEMALDMTLASLVGDTAASEHCTAVHDGGRFSDVSTGEPDSPACEVVVPQAENGAAAGVVAVVEGAEAAPAASRSKQQEELQEEAKEEQAAKPTPRAAREETEQRRGKGKGRNHEPKEDDRTERRWREKVGANGGGRDAEDAAATANSGARGAEGDNGGSQGGPGAAGAAPSGKGENAANNDNGETPSNYTTAMLRNIPNKYTREMLVKQLSIDFHGCFDFVYLPIDFKNKCNVGYGFINFTTAETCTEFVSQFHGVDVRKCLPGLNSRKVVEVTPARVQGLAENVRRLRSSPVMSQLQEHPEWMPLIFNKSGKEEPFLGKDTPVQAKPRGRNREGRHGGGS